MTLVVKPHRISAKLTGPLLASFVFLLTACSEPEPIIHDFAGSVMGTTWNVRVRTDADANPPDSNLGDSVQAELDRVDWLMSTYKSESELSLLNQAPTGEWLEVSPELAEVISLSLQIYRQTGGAFDITVGPVVNLWGFGPETVDVPATDQIDELMQNVGSDHIDLDGLKLRKSADIYIDLSAIAKGYAVDKVAELLESRHQFDYMVEVGGELRLSTPESDHSAEEQSSWRIAVEKPTELQREVQRILPIEKGGMATSGNYRNFIALNGETYSHTIDPTTGWPVQNALRSATVIMDTAAEADATATAMLVLGADRAMEYAKEHNIALLLLKQEGENLIELYSSAFEPFL